MTLLVLCGGSGTRLWPISRHKMPKQFYPFLDQGTLFEATVKRNRNFADKCLVAANRDQGFLAFEQLGRMGIETKAGLLEPAGKNTAPAIALCAMQLDADETMLVCPSDHLMLDEGAYGRAVSRAIELAGQGRLVTLGVEPSYPETGYGYIEHDGEAVVSFHEKPEEAAAARYCASGRFLWNIGVFCFKAGTLLEELRRHSPGVYDACRAIHSRFAGSELLEPDLGSMDALPSISIDYALMEKSDKVSVVPCDPGWSDLGSFDSIYPVCYDSKSKNSVLTETAPLFVESSGNLVIGKGQRKVVLVDVEGMTIVDTEDALLVAKRGSGQKVKAAVDALKRRDSALLDFHKESTHEWGSSLALFESDRVAVRRLALFPGKSLKIDSAGGRSFFLQLVAGDGSVSVDGKERVALGPSPSACVPSAGYELFCGGNETLVALETRIEGESGRPSGAADAPSASKGSGER